MLSTAPVIRPAGLGDAGVLSVLGKQTFTEAFGYLFEAQSLTDHLDERLDPDRLRASIQNPRHHFFLMEQANTAIGYYILKENEPHPAIDSVAPWQLQKIYLLAELTGQGYGAMLLAHAVEYGSAKGADRLWLGVVKQNPRGRAFYARNGFAFVAEDEHEFVGEKFSVDIMARAVR